VYSSLSPPFRTGWKRGGKRARQHVAAEYLDDVRADFSGYIAADELYDGPFCVLSIIDNRTFRRITYGVLDHDPTHAEIECFFRTFQTALAKLAELRRRARRFKRVGKTLQKLFSPNREKALTFLDDKLLPSTSNAVERGYRRHRKMQKTVYRVRTKSTISSRIALDMQREERAHQRNETIQTLHAARNRTAA
jgi:hypothetical protein